jgi:hypothetical protein
MVFVGGWRSRRRGFGPYGGGYGPGGYGGRRGGGGSCARDMCLVESGCCLADALGCGPQLGLVAPSLIRASLRSATASSGLRRFDVGVLLTRFVTAAIDFYQVEISPKRPPVCRYSPSCSTYAKQAISAHGLGNGGWLTLRRLTRCRPGAAGGYDPVPGMSQPSGLVAE